MRNIKVITAIGLLIAMLASCSAAAQYDRISAIKGILSKLEDNFERLFNRESVEGDGGFNDTLDEVRRQYESITLDEGIDPVNDSNFSDDYGEQFRYIGHFLDGWEALEQHDYTGAYRNFDLCAQLIWDGPLADVVNPQSALLRSYSHALYMMQIDDDIEALRIINELLSDNALTIAGLRSRMIDQRMDCEARLFENAQAAYTQAMLLYENNKAAESLGLFVSAQNMFTALLGSGYSLDASSRLSKIDEVLNNSTTGRVSDIRVSAEAFSAVVKWSSTITGSVYCVTYAPVGTPALTATTEARGEQCLLPELMPGTQYVVTVSIKDIDIKEEANFSTVSPPMFDTGYAGKFKGINLLLYKYSLNNENTFGSFTAKSSEVSGDTIELPKFSIETGDQGYYLQAVYNSDELSEDADFTYYIVMRTSDGGTFAITGAQKPVFVANSVVFDLKINELLKQLYDVNNAWTETTVRFELYLNGGYLAQTTEFQLGGDR